MSQTATQDPLERWNTATHEAGHAVMAFLMGKGPHGIAVFDKIRKEAMGCTHMKTAYTSGELDPKNEKDFQEAVSSTLCILAGIAADMLSAGHCDGGDLDHDEPCAWYVQKQRQKTFTPLWSRLKKSWQSRKTGEKWSSSHTCCLTRESFPAPEPESCSRIAGCSKIHRENP